MWKAIASGEIEEVYWPRELHLRARLGIYITVISTCMAAASPVLGETKER